MDHYIDIKLHPDPELPAPVLMNSLFAKLHRTLVEHANWQVGLSFPELGTEEKTTGFGTHLRLHGNQADLGELFRASWQGGLSGYTTTSNVQTAPATNKHVQLRRVQAKSSPSRLASRYQKRHDETEEAALERYSTMKPQKLALPYLTLKSGSTDQQFRLFIQQSQPKAEAVEGQFNRYGLSQTATVPWF